MYRHSLATPYESVEGKTVTFWLKDFLGPRGRFRYDTLPLYMEEWRKNGYNVHLLSVPRFLMVSGHTDALTFQDVEYPWTSHNEVYRTAKDAIAIKNGVTWEQLEQEVVEDGE